MKKAHRLPTLHQLFAPFALSSLLLFAACAAPPKTAYTGLRPEITAPSTLQYLGDTYTAGYSAITPHSAIVEYFLPGEGPKNWTRLLGLSLNRSGHNSSEFIRAFQTDLRKRDIPHQVTADPATGGHSINFMAVISGVELEFNIFRATDLLNQPGIITFQYAEMLNKKSMSKLESPQLRALREDRNKTFAELPIPTITLARPTTP